MMFYNGETLVLFRPLYKPNFSLLFGGMWCLCCLYSLDRRPPLTQMLPKREESFRKNPFTNDFLSQLLGH
jgi:hypothetical protein